MLRRKIIFFLNGRELIITKVKVIVTFEKKRRNHFWDFWSTDSFLCLCVDL